MKRFLTAVFLAVAVCSLHAQSITIDYSIYKENICKDSDKAEITLNDDGIITAVKLSKMSDQQGAAKEYAVAVQDGKYVVMLGEKEIASFTIDDKNNTISGSVNGTYSKLQKKISVSDKKSYEIQDAEDRRTLFFTSRESNSENKYGYTFVEYTSQTDADYEKLMSREMTSLTHFNSTDFSWRISYYKNDSYSLRCRDGADTVRCSVTSTLFPKTPYVEAVNMCILCSTEYGHKEIALPFIFGMCHAAPNKEEAKNTDTKNKKEPIFAPGVSLNDGQIGGGVIQNTEETSGCFQLSIPRIEFSLGRFLPGIMFNPFMLVADKNNGCTISFVNAYAYQPLFVTNFSSSDDVMRAQIDVYGGLRWLGLNTMDLEWRAGVIIALRMYASKSLSISALELDAGISYKNDKMSFYGVVVTSPAFVSILPAAFLGVFNVNF